MQAASLRAFRYPTRGETGKGKKGRRGTATKRGIAAVFCASLSSPPSQKGKRGKRRGVVVFALLLFNTCIHLNKKRRKEEKNRKCFLVEGHLLELFSRKLLGERRRKKRRGKESIQIVFFRGGREKRGVKRDEAEGIQPHTGVVYHMSL